MARTHALLRLAVRPVCRRPYFVARRAASSNPDFMDVWGIETSADDTCVALMQFRTDDQKGDVGRIRKIAKATLDNKKHGGIHPVEAVQSHTKNLACMLSDFVNQKGTRRPHVICVTRGPGMGGCLSVGVATAKALSAAWNVPIVGVHHMQAHALTVAMENALNPDRHKEEVAYPFLTLLVSGKHTMLLHTKSPVDHRILAQSDNIALGDVLDKVARELVPSSVIESQPDDLPICYPALLEQMTSELFASYVAPKSRKEEIQSYVSEFEWVLQPPLQGTRAMKYDFNGIGSQTRAALRRNPEMTEAERKVLGTQFMRLGFEHLMSRVFLALETDEELLRDPPKNLILSGGVASNMFLRTIIKETLKARGFGSIKLGVPSREYCTDNAAMIAYAGWKMFQQGWSTNLEFCPTVNWSIEEILSGVDCWRRRSGFPLQLAGPYSVTKDAPNTAQNSSSSPTEHEDEFPGQSLFFPRDPQPAREMTDSRKMVGLQEERLDNGDILSDLSEATAKGQTAKASEEQPEQTELPSKSKEEDATNKLAELPDGKSKAAETSSTASKKVASSKPLDPPKKEAQTAKPSSKPSNAAFRFTSFRLRGNAMDEVNLKLELLMRQADALMSGTVTSDSGAGNKSAAENSQAAALNTENKRTPDAQISTDSSTAQGAASASGGRVRRVYSSTAPSHSQSAGDKVEAEDSNKKMQLAVKDTGFVKKSTTGRVSWRSTPSDKPRLPLFKVWRNMPSQPITKEWPSMPAVSERGDLKVRHLGFAKEPSPPADEPAPTLMGRLAIMLGLGRK